MIKLYNSKFQFAFADLQIELLTEKRDATDYKFHMLNVLIIFLT